MKTHYKDCTNGHKTISVCYSCFVIKNKKLADYKENEATLQAEIAELKDKLHKLELQKSNYLEISQIRGREITDLLDKATKRAKDTIARRNKQIADVKYELKLSYNSNNELHARTNLLEDIVKNSGMWDYYCEGCFEYHKGNKEEYLKRCPKVI